MRRTFGNIARLVFAALAFVVVGGVVDAHATPVVSDIRIGDHKDKTRFVIDVSENIAFRVSTLPDPYRIVIDMPEVGWQLPSKPLPGKTGHIDSFRYGLFKPGNSRLVIDLGGPVQVKNAFVLPPRDGQAFRFVLDLSSSSREAFLRNTQPPSVADASPASGPDPAKAES
ncbi:MAG: AMIN domain-containing protein, partial [Rhodospirillales bacterium]|nr:AMIN domain-containing protein [Rhodospirillales bacterium]MCW8971227.1 AMIN domain-containing protein [Rhodospirillales bacterium]